jgi:hypothetical protein
MCSYLNAQQKARIENIRTHMTDKALVVDYDLQGTEEVYYRVDFSVVDNKGNAIRPDSVIGDLGSNVSAGEDLRITWEVYKEYDVIYGSFKPVLVLDKGMAHKRGPEYALLSLIVPGLGDYFVAEPANMVIKPWCKTAFTASVLGLSYLAKQKRVEVPELWAPPGYYLSADAPPGEDVLYMPDGYMIEPAKTDYWLFPYDSEIILGIGIASWMIDVLWVTKQGMINNRVRKTIPGTAAILPIRDGILLSYRLEF